jgi:hemerythrin-like domain-containing protein
VLASDHQAVLAMLDRFESMIGPLDQPTQELSQQGGALADTLITAESKHEAVEEEYFWPAVKEKLPTNGESLATTAIEQESAAKKVLARLDGMSPDQREFVPLVTEFVTAARAHIAYEQEQVWPSLREVLSDAEAEELGGKIEAAKKLAPTRPHPHTPPNPAVLKTAGVVAAATDKIRDALSHRHT